MGINAYLLKLAAAAAAPKGLLSKLIQSPTTREALATAAIPAAAGGVIGGAKGLYEGDMLGGAVEGAGTGAGIGLGAYGGHRGISQVHAIQAGSPLHMGAIGTGGLTGGNAGGSLARGALDLVRGKPLSPEMAKAAALAKRAIMQNPTATSSAPPVPPAPMAGAPPMPASPPAPQGPAPSQPMQGPSVMPGGMQQMPDTKAQKAQGFVSGMHALGQGT